MAKSNIALRSSSTGAPVEIASDSEVLWSSGDNWPGLIVEEYKFRQQYETPEFETSDHRIAIHQTTPVAMEVTIQGLRETYTRQSGDIVFVPAGAARQFRSMEGHGLLVMSLSPKIVADMARRSRGRPVPSLVEQHRLRDAQLERFAQALKAEAASGYAAGPLFGEALGLALAAHLSNNYGASDPLGAQRGGMGPRQLRRVLEYIHDNVNSVLRMETLANIAGLSPFRFAHNFKAATGLAPHQYVIRARVERGKELLRSTKLPVLEIANAVGCQNSSHFAQLFRRETGTSPSSYRAQL